MKLFKTTRRRTSYRQPRRAAGYTTTLTAKTRLKRWVRRSRKKLWRKAKARTKRLWRKLTPKRQARKRRIARNARQFRRHHATIHGQQREYPNVGTLPGQVRTPPPDGALGKCRLCHNEVEYNGHHARWEHTGPGKAACFKPYRG